MKRTMMGLLVALSLIMGCGAPAMAAPLVYYSVSGSAGNWELDFTVVNNLGGTNSIYCFGVQLPAHNMTGIPSGWGWASGMASYTSVLLGLTRTYNNVWWQDGTATDIQSGTSMNGFKASVSTVEAPTSVYWFAYAHGGVYLGSDHAYTDQYPTFESQAGEVPIPAAFLLLGPGLVGLAAIKNRFRK